MGLLSFLLLFNIILKSLICFYFFQTVKRGLFKRPVYSRETLKRPANGKVILRQKHLPSPYPIEIKMPYKLAYKNNFYKLINKN